MTRLDSPDVPASFTYWAFISYNSADKAVARWLHSALERYRIPRAFVGQAVPEGKVPRKLYPCFRDREELAAGPDLPASLKKALDESAWCARPALLEAGG